MHPQLTYMIAKERVAEMCAAAERSRWPDTDSLVLSDGRRLKIRPIQRGDRDLLRRLFIRLTPESRYRRYLTPKPELSERELDHLLDVDHVRHEALAAVDEADGSFVGVARYVQMPDQPGVADVAIEVADDLHGQGIGTALATRTLERARANGFARLTAITLHDSAAARALLRRLHFRGRSRSAYDIEFELELAPDLAKSAARPSSATLSTRNAAKRQRGDQIKAARNASPMELVVDLVRERPCHEPA